MGDWAINLHFDVDGIARGNAWLTPTQDRDMVEVVYIVWMLREENRVPWA